MIDAPAIIMAHLLRDTTLTALTSTRIYAERDVPPVGYKPGDDGACVTFRVRGGGPDYEDALLLPSVQFKCYGTSEVEANEVYRALYGALHNSHASTVLHAEVEVLGQTLEEPATGWHFVLTFFRIILRQ